jgi:glycosyltransferase involved in cell wall biosynthesis
MAHQAEILARYLEQDGIDVHRVPTNLNRNIVVARDLAMWKRWLAVKDAVDVVNVQTCCYTSYFTMSAPIIWWAKRAGKRVIVTYKGGSALEVFERTGEAGLRWLRMADVVTVQSGFLRDVFERFGVATKLVPDLFEADVPQEEPKTPDPDSPRLVMTRGLGSYYNVGCTLRAFQEVQKNRPNAKLLLAGRGNREKPLRKLVSDLAVPNIEFLGWQNRAQMHDLYRSADICVNSSDVDNMPGALLEAFLFGVPVVSTDAGGIPYMIEHGRSGRLVPMGDHEALAREVLFLLDNPEIARDHATKAQASLDQYCWEAMRPLWLETIGVDQSS